MVAPPPLGDDGLFLSHPSLLSDTLSPASSSDDHFHSSFLPSSHLLCSRPRCACAMSPPAPRPLPAPSIPRHSQAWPGALSISATHKGSCYTGSPLRPPRRAAQGQAGQWRSLRRYNTVAHPVRVAILRNISFREFLVVVYLFEIFSSRAWPYSPRTRPALLLPRV